MRASSLRFSRCLLPILAFAAASIAAAAPPDGYDFRPLGDALRLAATDRKPTLIYFGRYGCTTCRKMHAEVFSDAELMRRYNAGFALAYVDTESADRIRLPNGEHTTEMQFAVRSRIHGTPTFVFISPDQKPLFRKAGLQSVAQMLDYCEYLTGDHYRNQTLEEFLASR